MAWDFEVKVPNNAEPAALCVVNACLVALDVIADDLQSRAGSGQHPAAPRFPRLLYQFRETELLPRPDERCGIGSAPSPVSTALPTACSQYCGGGCGCLCLSPRTEVAHMDTDAVPMSTLTLTTMPRALARPTSEAPRARGPSDPRARSSHSARLSVPGIKPADRSNLGFPRL
eukprot:s353_g14.t1